MNPPTRSRADASDHDAIGIHVSVALALAAVIESLAVAAQPLQR